MASQNRAHPDADLKHLYGNSAGLCGFPECRRKCLVDKTSSDKEKNIGKIAHIEAHSDNGPRSNPKLTMKERDCYGNWILLCPTHHDLVDVQPNTYTVDDLRHWKSEHEEWVRKRTSDEIPNVSFAELDAVCQVVLVQPNLPGDDRDVTLTPPVEKMQKNNLTDRTETSVKMGLAVANKVKGFIAAKVRLDVNFPTRLKEGFVQQYNLLWHEGLRGDDLFEALQQFASDGSHDFRYQAASLVVLSYLFEKCDIFER